MHEEHRANPENTRTKTKKKQKRKPTHRLITKRKRANERRERITSHESPSLRPFKKSPTKISLKRCRGAQAMYTGSIKRFINNYNDQLS